MGDYHQPNRTVWGDLQSTAAYMSPRRAGALPSAWRSSPRALADESEESILERLDRETRAKVEEKLQAQERLEREAIEKASLSKAAREKQAEIEFLKEQIRLKKAAQNLATKQALAEELGRKQQAAAAAGAGPPPQMDETPAEAGDAAFGGATGVESGGESGGEGGGETPPLPDFPAGFPPEEKVADFWEPPPADPMKRAEIEALREEIRLKKAAKIQEEAREKKIQREIQLLNQLKQDRQRAEERKGGAAAVPGGAAGASAGASAGAAAAAAPSAADAIEARFKSLEADKPPDELSPERMAELERELGIVRKSPPPPPPPPGMLSSLKTRFGGGEGGSANGGGGGESVSAPAEGEKKAGFVGKITDGISGAIQKKKEEASSQTSSQTSSHTAPDLIHPPSHTPTIAYSPPPHLAPYGHTSHCSYIYMFLLSILTLFFLSVYISLRFVFSISSQSHLNLSPDDRERQGERQGEYQGDHHGEEQEGARGQGAEEEGEEGGQGHARE